MSSARKTLVRGSALVIASTFFWHGTNFAYNSIGAHLLGPASYGTLAATTALLAIFTPLFVAIQTISSRVTTTKIVAGDRTELRGLLAYYGIRVGLTGLFVGAAIALLSTAVARALRMPSHWPVAVLGGVVVFSVLTHLQRGVLQGVQAFGRYSVSTTVEAAAKLVFTVLFVVVISRTVTSAVAGLVIASAIAVAANGWLLRFLPRATHHADPVDHPFRYSLTTLAALVGLALLLAIHLVNPRGMGMGDVKLAGILGLYLGFLGVRQVLFGLFLGFLLGAAGGILLIVTGIRSRRDHIPFAPFLAAGAILAVLLGSGFSDWYGG